MQLSDLARHSSATLTDVVDHVVHLPVDTTLPLDFKGTIWHETNAMVALASAHVMTSAPSGGVSTRHVHVTEMEHSDTGLRSLCFEVVQQQQQQHAELVHIVLPTLWNLVTHASDDGTLTFQYNHGLQSYTDADTLPNFQCLFIPSISANIVEVVGPNQLRISPYHPDIGTITPLYLHCRYTAYIPALYPYLQRLFQSTPLSCVYEEASDRLCIQALPSLATRGRTTTFRLFPGALQQKWSLGTQVCSSTLYSSDPLSSAAQVLFRVPAAQEMQTDALARELQRSLNVLDVEHACVLTITEADLQFTVGIAAGHYRSMAHVVSTLQTTVDLVGSHRYTLDIRAGRLVWSHMDRHAFSVHADKGTWAYDILNIGGSAWNTPACVHTSCSLSDMYGNRIMSDRGSTFRCEARDSVLGLSVTDDLWSGSSVHVDGNTGAVTIDLVGVHPYRTDQLVACTINHAYFACSVRSPTSLCIETSFPAFVDTGGEPDLDARGVAPSHTFVFGSKADPSGAYMMGAVPAKAYVVHPYGLILNRPSLVPNPLVVCLRELNGHSQDYIPTNRDVLGEVQCSALGTHVVFTRQRGVYARSGPARYMLTLHRDMSSTALTDVYWSAVLTVVQSGQRVYGSN